MNKTTIAVLSAFLSAILYAVCIPFAKILGNYVPSVVMGGLLYLGAGLGLLITTFVKQGSPELALTKKDIPYMSGVVFLDIAAILLLMFGLANTTGANAALLGNFELAATTIAAFFVFKEFVSKRLVFAIILITVASIILSFEGEGSFVLNIGSISVLLACICWGVENNCTRMLSIRDTRQITLIKGCFSGLGGLIIAFLAGETLPAIKWVILVLLLGFISYGVSVTLYIYAQRFLGATKTASCYSTAPFFGVLFSLLILGERPEMSFYVAFLVMVVATILVIRDTQNS